MTERRFAAALAGAAVVAVAFAAPALADRVEGPFGRGAGQVWLVLPDRPPRAVVVFGHGWKRAPPLSRFMWVDQFRPWLDHLAERGDAVLFPRYQVGGDAGSGAARAIDYRRGLVTGFARLGPLKVPVIAAGYSFGASLAFYYAADARRWALPPPVAVDGIFPAGLISGAALPPLGHGVRVLIQVGEADTVAGTAGAAPFWSWLRGHAAARKRYVVVASTPGLAAMHAAPMRTNAGARRAFWRPLDALVAAARSAP